MSGVPFLKNQLGANARLIVEIAWGADLTANPGTWTWTDVSTDVLMDPGISIMLGRRDEFSQAPPANCSFRLKNQTGTYTANNPASSNYPFVRQGTPVRVRVSLDGGSTWSVRFQGYANGFSPAWDAQGKKAYVNASASGILRRLLQGNKPLRSALYRAITGATVQPVAYWPFEDGSQAQQANSPIAGCPPATFNYLQVLGSPQFAQVTGPPGSDRLPDFSLQANFSAPIPRNANGLVGTATTWRVQCIAKVDPLPTSSDDVVPLAWFTNNKTALNNVFIVKAGGIFNGFTFQDSNGNTFQSGVGGFDDGGWHEYRAVMTQSGGNIVLNVFVDGTLIINQTYAGTLNNVTDLNGTGTSMTNSNGFACGHYAIWNTNTGLPDTVDAMRGHPGETTTARLTRLCAEQDVPLSIVGTSVDTMGPQGVDTFANQLREIETTEVGSCLLDGLGPGLTYVCRSSIYNEAAQVTVDANAGQVLANNIPQPVQDDLNRANLVTVTRKNGSSVTVEDVTGPVGTNAVGVYDTQVTVNTATDGPLNDIASWLVGPGQVEMSGRELHFVARHEAGHAAAMIVLGAGVERMTWTVNDGELYGVTTWRTEPPPVAQAVIGWCGPLAVNSMRGAESDLAKIRALNVKWAAHRGPRTVHEAAGLLLADYARLVDLLADAFIQAGLHGNGVLTGERIDALLGLEREGAPGASRGADASR